MLEKLDRKRKDRYLKILGVSERKPGLDFLKSLVKAHLTKIPFENISKIYFQKKYYINFFPDFDLYLDKIEKYNFGGTCYANNYHFYLLLISLGYNVKLCGADMMNPDVHIVMIVEINGEEYIVDGGYGAPFLQPVPRFLKKNYTIIHGNDKYIFRPMDKKGRTRMDMFRNGKIHHGYMIKPEPRKIDDFKKVIKSSFTKNAVFFNAILITRFYNDHSYVLHNMTFVEYRGKKMKTINPENRMELVKLIERKFGMPGRIVSEAIREIKKFVSAW
jgi:arylamine N-acetyltransferase